MLIKFNNIRDLADARYAASVMAEWIGFRIGGSEELSAAAIQEIIGWCSGPKVILELEPEVNHDKVQVLLDILPVDGLEVSAEHAQSWMNHFSGSDLEWIVRGAATAENCWTHRTDNIHGSRVINCIKPEDSAFELIQSGHVEAISLDCFPSESTGIKDFSQWNDFFDRLDL